MSAITGADLKNRIARIMSQSAARKLEFRKKLLLGFVGLAAFVLPFAFGLLNAKQTHAYSHAENTSTSSFVYDSVSVKLDETSTAIMKSGKGAIHQRMLGTPRRLTITNTPVQQLIQEAYGVQSDRVLGAPDWFNLELFDVEAKIDSATAERLQKLSPDQREFARRRMLQTLLEDHFKLAVHRETFRFMLCSSPRTERNFTNQDPATPTPTV